MIVIFNQEVKNMRNQVEQKPTILLIEDDDETRRLLIENFRARSYRILSAIHEEDAIQYIVNNAETHPSLILINQVKISTNNCLEIIQRIYQQTGLDREIPAIIIAEQYRPTLQGTEEKIDDNKYIIYLEEAQQLFDLVDRLCSRN